MVHLGSQIRRQLIQFFVGNATASFEKSLPEGPMRFAWTCIGWERVACLSVAIWMTCTLVLLQLLQCCGDQGRDGLAGLT